MKSIVAAALAALALAACQPSQPTQPSSSAAPAPAASAAATAGACSPELLAALKGLELSAAQARLDAAQVPHRVVRDGDQSFPVTADHRPDRVSLEVEAGKVAAASCG